MKRVVIVGATSAIAQATARRWAEQGCALVLLARDRDKLNTVAADLRVRGAHDVFCIAADLGDLARHQEWLDAAWAQLGSVDIVLVAFGSLPDQAACEREADVAVHALHINVVSPIALLTRAAALVEQHGAGTLAVITSVAGDRGRASNYVYGAAKAALSTFLSGLRNRTAGSGVRVIDIKPGFIDTPMTAAFPKGRLWVQPDTAARRITSAIASGQDVAYVPRRWWWIMLAIRHLPEALFKKIRW